MRKLVYTCALLMAVLFAALQHRPVHSTNNRVHLGAQLPRWSTPIEENRFRSPSNWDQTQTWINRTYNRQQFPRIEIVNLPGIKAMHIANRSGQGEYSGINVYEMSDGEVRFYVLPRITE